MKKKLKEVWKKLSKFFTNNRVVNLERLVTFEISKRKELEHKVNLLELENRRIKFDVNKAVNAKIEDYEKLFTASKQYGDNLLRVAVKTHENIHGRENKK